MFASRIIRSARLKRQRRPNWFGRRAYRLDSAPRWNDEGLLLNWAEDSKDTILPSFWLRDHCQCEQCRHAVTKQRLVDTFKVLGARPSQTTTEDHNLKIEWDDGHSSLYPLRWLFNHTSSSKHGESRVKEPTLTAKSETPSVSYEAVMASEIGLQEWLQMIHTHGFCFIDDCPPTPEATETLLTRIAFIRHTHYGGFWDFTADLASHDTAYTNLALEAHTDTAYFTDPCGLQMFHLLSHTEGEGGASLLVDGFAAAQRLKNEAPWAYETLSTIPISFHASGNESISIQPAKPFPVLNHDSLDALQQMRWNNADRATLPPTLAEKWYPAAAELNRIIASPDMEIWRQLTPGRPMIFDNWRMLHGRSAFTGRRRMCGGYINHDDYMSRYRMLTQGREAVLEAV